MKQWTFLTSHAHVLIAIARDPTIRVRDIAAHVGITERSAQRIIADLEAEGFLRHERTGRRNHYTPLPDAPLRHPINAPHTVGDLIDALAPYEQS